MKKFLSFILVLAMVLSCVSMVTFASDEEWSPDENTVTGVKFIGDRNDTNKTLRTANAGLTADMITEEGDERYILLQFRLYNLNDVNVAFTIEAETGWTNLQTGLVTYPGHTNESSSKQTVLAHQSKVFTAKIPVDSDNKVLDVSGNPVDLSTISFRFDTTTSDGYVANQEFIIQAVNAASAPFVNASYNNYEFTVTERITGTEYYNTIPTAKSVQYTVSVVTSSHDLAVTDAPLFAADATFTGTKYVGYTFYNTSNCDYTFYMTLNLNNASKTRIADQYNVIVPAGKQASIVIPIAVSAGVYTYSSTTYNLNEIFIRFDINKLSTSTETVGDTFSIAPLNEDSSNAIFLSLKAPGNTTRKVKTSIPTECETFTNGDASLGVTSNWTTFNGGSNASATDPDDETNKVIKYTPAGNVWHSGSFNFASAIIYNPNMNLYGGGAGEYTISFRIRFVDATVTGKFGMEIVESNNRKITKGITGTPVITGTEWTTHTATFTITEEIHQQLVDGNHTTFKLRINGGNAGYTYADTGLVSYYLDDMTIVKTPEITGIEVLSKPNKTEYEFGEELNTTGLSLKVLLDNGTHETVTEGFEVSGFDSSTAGTQTVTVSYEGFEAAFEVTVKEKAPEPDHIQVTGPDKTTYESGEEFDSTGLKVELVYDNGTTKPLTPDEYILSEIDTLLPGAKTITVSYGTFTETFDITVNVSNPAGLYIDITSASAGAGAVVLNGQADKLFESNTSFTGTKKIAYKVYNPTDRALKFEIVAVKYDSWSTLGSATRTTTIPAKSWGICYLDIAFTNGVYSETDMGDIRLRFNAYFTNVTVDDYCVVVPCDDDNTYILNVTYQNASGAKTYHIGEIPAECSELTRYVAETDYNNGDASNGTVGWSLFHSGSVTNVADPDDKANNVIKFTPVANTTGYYYLGCPQYDLAPFLINNQYVNMYGGQGVGIYDLTFRIKAEGEYNQKFSISLSTNDQKVTLKSGDSSSFVMYVTGEWQTITASFVVTQAFLDQCVASNLTTIGFRFDGGTSYRDNGMFSYYIDDVTFVKRDASKYEGIKITASTIIESQDAGTRVVTNPANLTADMAENGIITRKYALYNTSNDIIYVSMYHQGGPDHYKTLAEGKSAGSVVLHPGQRTVFTFEIVLTENGGVLYKTNDGNLEGLLSDVNVRFEIAKHSTYTTVNQGSGFYIQSLNENDGILAARSKDPYIIQCVEDFSFYNKFDGAAPILGESIALDIVAKAEYGEDVELRVTRDNGELGGYVKTLKGVEAAGVFTFRYYGINAQCMGDELLFELIVDGITVATYDYSVKQYVINMFGTTAAALGLTDEKYTQLKTLLSDMLVYGAEAQKAIGYKTDALATENLYDADGNPITLTPSNCSAPDYVREIGEGNTSIRTAGLNISYVNKIYFRLTDVTENFTSITVTVNGKEVNFTTNDDKVYTDDIKATEFDKVYTITVVDAAGNVSTVSYNANAYIAQKMATSSIAKALNNYGQSAVAYKG